jgi:transposase
MTTPIHAALKAKDCLPATQWVDSGYVGAKQLVSSQQDYDIDLVGPTRLNTGWQAREGTGFTSRDCTIDGENQQATCPAGKMSLHWWPALNNHGTPVIQIKFSKRECRICEMQPHCTRANPPRRTITIYPEALHKARPPASANKLTLLQNNMRDAPVLKVPFLRGRRPSAYPKHAIAASSKRMYSMCSRPWL